jgi:glycyl-tRNA synthetase
LQGIADRTDFDLKAHMSESKQDMSYFDPINNKKFIPYVIEPSIGLTRLFLAVLLDSYVEESGKLKTSPQLSSIGGEGEESRIYLKLNPKLAPIKV